LILRIHRSSRAVAFSGSLVAAVGLALPSPSLAFHAEFDALDPPGKAAMCAAVLVKASRNAEQSLVQAVRTNARDPYIDLRLKAAREIGERSESLRRWSQANRPEVYDKAARLLAAEPLDPTQFDRAVSLCLDIERRFKETGVTTSSAEDVLATKARLKAIAQTLRAR
jgi:hypothetical protein